ncbi:MAG: GAF domain-containing protein [Woeseia sp.]
MPLKLTVFPPDLPGRQVTLHEGHCYLLGRSAAADVVVADRRISGRHLLIDGCGSFWKISDQASKNGTRVDGRPLDNRTLDRPAWLNLGGVPAFVEPQSLRQTQAAEKLGERRRAAAGSIGRGLQGKLTARILLKRCLEALLELSGCERAYIWTVGENGVLRPLMLQGPARPGPSRSVIEEAVVTGNPVALSDTAGAETVLRRGSIERGGIRALVVLPLKSHGRCLGVLYADSQRPGKIFTELDVELLSGIASQASVVLAVTRLRSELDSLAASAPPQV